MYIILKRFNDDKQEQILIQHFNESECKKILEQLKKEAKERNVPVEYRMDYVEGEVQYSGKEFIDKLKANGANKILVQNGEVHGIKVPIYEDKDVKGE